MIVSNRSATSQGLLHKDLKEKPLPKGGPDEELSETEEERGSLSQDTFLHASNSEASPGQHLSLPGDE